MIDGIGKSGPRRIDAQRPAGAGGAAAAAPVGDARIGPSGGALAELLGEGAPVDTNKVAQIRAAIAEGRYSVDPDRIAERMIAADLGR
jgi:negative regulator of flagellin synthesis FlgM